MPKYICNQDCFNCQYEDCIYEDDEEDNEGIPIAPEEGQYKKYKTTESCKGGRQKYFKRYYMNNRQKLIDKAKARYYKAKEEGKIFYNHNRAEYYKAYYIKNKGRLNERIRQRSQEQKNID